MDYLRLVGEMFKKLLAENIRKMLGSKIVQVKGFMPQGSGIAKKHPPAEPLGELWYGITFSAVQEFVILWNNLIWIFI